MGDRWQKIDRRVIKQNRVKICKIMMEICEALGIKSLPCHGRMIRICKLIRNKRQRKLSSDLFKLKLNKKKDEKS